MSKIVIINKNDATGKQSQRKADDDEYGKARLLFLRNGKEITSKTAVEEIKSFFFLRCMLIYAG